MRCFNLRNGEQKRFALTNLNGVKAKFQYQKDGLTPSLRKIRYEIIEALKERNFKVKGVVVDFWHNGSGNEHTIQVYKIKYNLIEFRSSHSVSCKGIKLYLFDDGSGSLEMYCGSNWKKDKKDFEIGKIHRKIDNLSRIILKYNLVSRTQFKATNDCRREYYPNNNEPEEYYLNDIENILFKKAENLLTYIKSFPAEGYDSSIFDEPDPIFFTNGDLKGIQLRTFINEDDLNRMKILKINMDFVLILDY